MAENTEISWTDHTFNPWIGCQKVSPGCDNCYAAQQDKFRHWTPEGWGGPRKRTSVANWNMPVRWNAQAGAFAAQHGRRQRVFCSSLADVFDNAVETQWRIDLWDLIDATPNLDWLLLTKRVGNVAKMVPLRWLQPGAWPKHVRIGATIVNQEEADRDIEKLLALCCPNFLSMEPLLGAVDIYMHLGADHKPWGYCYGVNWVIVGGESGPGARPMHPDWARSLRDQCAATGVPYHFKQWGEWAPAPADFGPSWSPLDEKQYLFQDGPEDAHTLMLRVGKKAAGHLLDGVAHQAFPEVRP